MFNVTFDVSNFSFSNKVSDEYRTIWNVKEKFSSDLRVNIVLITNDEEFIFAKIESSNHFNLKGINNKGKKINLRYFLFLKWMNFLFMFK